MDLGGHCTWAEVLLRMQDLHFTTNDICIAPRLANPALKGTDGLMKKKHTQNKGAPLAPWPLNPLSLKKPRGGGGAGGCRIQGPGPAAPPPPLPFCKHNKERKGLCSDGPEGKFAKRGIAQHRPIIPPNACPSGAFVMLAAPGPGMWVWGAPWGPAPLFLSPTASPNST